MQTRNTPKGFSTAAKFFIVFGALSLGGLSFIVWNTFAGSQIDSTLKQYSGTGGIENGLVVHFTFDGVDMPSGQANDTSGNANNGSLANMASSTMYIRGVTGQALNFDGSNDIVKFTEQSFSGPFSISLWWKANPTVGIFRIAISESLGGSVSKFGMTDTLNKIFVRVVNGGSTDTTTALPADFTMWHHYVLTRNASDKVDLAIDGGTPVRLFSDVAQSGTASWGRIGGVSAQQFRGGIDDVRIYNRALSSDEIKQLYQMGEPGGGKISATPNSNPTLGGINYGLIGYWTFDGKDMPGGLVSDISGNGNHASRRSMATSTSYVSGSIGQALWFDGFNDSIDLGDISAVESSALTFATWVKHEPGGLSRDGDYFTKGTHATNNPLLIWRDDVVTGGDQGGNTNAVSCFIDDGPQTRWIASPTNSLNDTLWHHVVCSFEANSVTGLKIYIDGVLQQTGDTTNVDQPENTATSIRLGMPTPDNSNVAMLGTMDDVRIYNRALSSDEIKQLYQMGEPGGGKISATPNSNPTLGGINYGLIGYWTFDGKDMPAGRVNDVSGQGNTGSSKNMATSSAYVQGVLGQALNFDGTDDRIDVGSASILDDIAPMSISFWMYPRSLGQSSNANVIGKHSVNSANPQNGWDIAMTPTNTIGIRFDYGTVGSSADDLRRDAANGSVTYRTWQHVVMTWDGSSTATNIHIYINGVEVSYTNTQNGTGSRNTDAAQDLNIGNSIGNSRTFDGYLDDVRIYNRVISLDETKQLYQMGR